MQLLPDPLYSIPTDNTYMLAITSTDLGRIFLAGKDGCLYEIAYQAEAGWFSQRCRKINHSKSTLSFLIPSLLQFSFSEDGKNVKHRSLMDRFSFSDYTVCSFARLEICWCFFFFFLSSRLISVSVVDPVVQVAIDNSRNTLYTRSEKGVLQVSGFIFDQFES